MSTPLPSEISKQELKQAKERIDEYEGTIHAIWSFISLATWDKNARRPRGDAQYEVGKQMITSDQNQISKKTVVTPDTVIQVGNQLGYVVEVKYSMPLNQTHWQDEVFQLIKYDDNLTGWWTKNKKMDFHNIVLLIEYARSVLFRDFIVKWLNDQNIKFGRNFAIIEFTKSDNANFYYGFRKIYGDIQDDEFSTQLYQGVKVPRDGIVSAYGAKKFYDAKPPIIEYTMVTLWMHVLLQLRVKENIEFNKNLKAYPIYIDINELTTETQRLYGQTSEISNEKNIAFPKADWIKDALDELEKMDLARKLNREFDAFDYLILYKDIHVEDLLEYFVNHRKKRSSKKGKQLNLF